jgi:glycosyltransferase involved in cell wall biosynthesis
VNAERQAELRKELDIRSDQFVLGYVGSIGTWYMLPEMLDFFKVLLNFKPDAVFLFVSNEGDKIKELVAEKGISESKIRIVSCLHSQVASYISLFSVSIYFIIPAYSKKASSPTKQAELMAMGIPVICNAGVGDSDLIVKKYNAGWVVEEFETEEYERIINEITVNKQIDRIKLVEDARYIFDLATGADIFYHSYKRILKL